MIQGRKQRQTGFLQHGLRSPKPLPLREEDRKRRQRGDGGRQGNTGVQRI